MVRLKKIYGEGEGGGQGGGEGGGGGGGVGEVSEKGRRGEGDLTIKDG